MSNAISPGTVLIEHQQFITNVKIFLLKYREKNVCTVVVLPLAPIVSYIGSIFSSVFLSDNFFELRNIPTSDSLLMQMM